MDHLQDIKPNPNIRLRFRARPPLVAQLRAKAYQFRRTVIILPYAQPVPKGSSVVAEVCLMPWRKYISQIVGQCNGKFTVWK
jgi:hypothetical protein